MQDEMEKLKNGLVFKFKKDDSGRIQSQIGGQWISSREMNWLWWFFSLMMKMVFNPSDSWLNSYSKQGFNT